MSPLLSRRAAALVAAPVLALGGLAVLPSAPASAAEPDTTPVAHGAGWLSDQLTDGLVHNTQYDFDDYGLSIDVGLALAEVGGHGAAVDAISTALAANITAYVGDNTTESYAGALGKAAVFARLTGAPVGSYGGVDLVTRLENRVGTAGATAGRIADASAFGDYANPIGQAFAVRALDEASSPLAESATEFLIDQQCADGGFRAVFADAAASDQTCDGDPAAESSVDVTALAVLQLEGQSDDTDVQAVIDDALAWLVSVQRADGSFLGSGDTAVPNANSTGLAGWALGDNARASAAYGAAVWLRQHQADDFGPCTTGLTGATGTIAYDDAALAEGRSAGIVTETEDQFRRATAQALPALQWAPAGTYSPEPTSSSGFVKALSTQTVEADFLAPGQTVCFARGASQALVNADATGFAIGRVKLPAGSGTRTYTVGLTDGVLGKISFRALAAKTLPVTLKKKVAKGGKQVVTVKGLARGEFVVLSYTTGNTSMDFGTQAPASGKVTFRFGVGKAVGTTKVKVRGQFGNRKAVKTFTVTKG